MTVLLVVLDEERSFNRYSGKFRKEGKLVKGIHRINYATFSDSLPILTHVVDYGGKKNND